MPFQNYIRDQLSRNRIIKSHDDMVGACRAFQRGLKKTTFVIDTLGRYSECNLIDADSHVLNPGGNQPDYCKGCKWEFAEECNPCGSVDFPDHCEFRWRWNEMVHDYNRRMQYKNMVISQTKRRINNNFSNLIWNA